MAEELGWQPSIPARALTRARTRAISLVLARRADNLEADDFFVRFLAGVERTPVARNYGVLHQLVAPDAGGRLDAYRRL